MSLEIKLIDLKRWLNISRGKEMKREQDKFNIFLVAALIVIVIFLFIIDWKSNIQRDQIETRITQLESSLDQINNWQIRHDENEVYKMNYVKE